MKIVKTEKNGNRINLRILGFIKLSFKQFDIKQVFNAYLQRKGLKIEPVGLGYIEANETLELANKENLSLCDYLEKKAVKDTGEQIRLGRRNRIIDEIINTVGADNIANVLEIGTGTGMYMESLIGLENIKAYENYETNVGWREYLNNKYFNDKRVKNYICDGKTLSYTKNDSCDLIHSHAVFVYLPILMIVEYLQEMARVCKNGGYIVFDILTENSLSYNNCKKWLNGDYRFPTLFPTELLLEFAKDNKLELIKKFNEIYGNSFVEYFIFRNNGE